MTTPVCDAYDDHASCCGAFRDNWGMCEPGGAFAAGGDYDDYCRSTCGFCVPTSHPTARPSPAPVGVETVYVSSSVEFSNLRTASVIFRHASISRRRDM